MLRAREGARPRAAHALSAAVAPAARNERRLIPAGMMASVPDRPSRKQVDLQQLAKQHLWLHFSRMGAYASGQADIPVFVRGDGPYLFDDTGRRYLDGLSGLFTVQVGHGRADIAAAGARQGEQLAYYPIWSAAHPTAIELAARLAALAPGDLNRVFFTSGGAVGGGAAGERAPALLRAHRRAPRPTVVGPHP